MCVWYVCVQCVSVVAPTCRRRSSLVRSPPRPVFVPVDRPRGGSLPKPGVLRVRRAQLVARLMLPARPAQTRDNGPTIALVARLSRETDVSDERRASAEGTPMTARRTLTARRQCDRPSPSTTLSFWWNKLLGEWACRIPARVRRVPPLVRGSSRPADGGAQDRGPDRRHARVRTDR